MIKFTAELGRGGHLFGFGLSETDLNRLEFNKEPIIFDFGYIDQPHLIGLILYMGQYEEPDDDITPTLDELKAATSPFLDNHQGITAETLRIFYIAHSILYQWRKTPFWGFETAVEITHPNDRQLFAAGRTDEEIIDYLVESGLLPRSHVPDGYLG